MLILAGIPAVALLVILILVLRTRHQYQARLEWLRADMAERRRSILAADETNDRRLVTAVASASTSITELLQKYCNERAAIALGANATDGASWTIQEVNQWLGRNAADQATRIGRTLLYRTLLMTVAVLATAAGGAALRYHQVSVAPRPTESDEDPSSQALPVDPFAQPVPDATPTDTKTH